MMPLMYNNVVTLNSTSVFQDITTFLIDINNNVAGKYESSAKEYERDIKRFFKLMLGKELNELKIQDLYFLPKDVKKYQNHMISVNYKSATVNRSIASMKSLYSFFESNKYKFIDENGETIHITADQFDVKKIHNNDSNSYGIYSDSEIKELIELAKTLNNGERKSLAIELASVTSIRIEAVANVKRSDFRKENDTWVVQVVDKDTPHVKPIRDDLYERLMNVAVDDKIFDMSSRTLERDLKTLNTRMGLDPDRNLTFHSIKKYGINEVFKITGGDIMETANQGNHKSFETAMKYYMEFNKDFSKMPCLMIGQEVDTSPLDALSHEELLNLIKNSERGLQYDLISNLKKSLA